MKPTTQNIQSLINEISKKLEIIKERIEKNEINGNTSHQELTLKEAVDNLDEYLGILNQTIDYIDSLPFSQRYNILQTLSRINNTLVNNRISNIHQYIQDVESINNYIHIFSLKEIAPDFPNFNRKLQQLKTLEEKEREIIKTFEKNQAQFEKFDEIYKQVIEKSKDIENDFRRIVNLLEQARTNLNEINTNKANIDSLFKEISEIKSKAKDFLDEIEQNQNEIIRFRENIDSHLSRIQQVEDECNNKIQQFQNKIQEFENRTNEIINKNEEYQEQIKQLLTSAVGTNLFKSFDIRKNELKKGLWGWLVGIILSALFLFGLGVWIYNDIKSEHIEWSKTILKIAVSFPVLYLLVFFTNRYSKDKQLLEEYAFKSTLSLALKPYAELVDETENKKVDSKYRDFLIASILQIFTSPTESVYKHHKSEGLDISEMIRKFNIFKKE